LSTPHREGGERLFLRDPIERAALVNRLRKRGMTDDEVNEIELVVDA
jgi:hypothetical protein